MLWPKPKMGLKLLMFLEVQGQKSGRHTKIS